MASNPSTPNSWAMVGSDGSVLYMHLSAIEEGAWWPKDPPTRFERILSSLFDGQGTEIDLQVGSL